MIKNAEQRVAARYIPKGARAVRCKVSGSVVYLYSVGGRPCFKGFRGTAENAAINYGYRVEAQRDKAAAIWLAGEANYAKTKATSARSSR